MPDPERMYVACDVSNLLRSCRDEFGEGARVDFQILGSMAPALRHPAAVQQVLVAYVTTSPKQQHHALSELLRHFGYRIRARHMRHKKGALKPTRTDWDVGITIDALDQIDTYDTFVLASGDGDFVDLIHYLKTRGKRTMVLSFGKSTSRSLYDVADELHALDNVVARSQGVSDA